MEKRISLFFSKDNINKVMHSNLFLSILTALLFICWAFDLTILSCVIVVLTIAFSTIYLDDGNVIGALIPLTMFSYSNLPYFNSIPIHLIIELVALFVGLIVMVIKRKKETNFKFSFGAIGLGLISIGLISFVSELIRYFTSLNPNSNYNTYGFISVLFLFMIVGAYLCLHHSNINNKNEYINKVFLAINLLLIAEVTFIFVTNGFQKIDFNLLKWGEKNTFALGLEICLPFVALLFDNNHKRLEYLLLLILDYILIVLSMSRGGTLTIMLLLPLLIFIGLYSLPNRGKICRLIFIGSLVLIPVCYFFFPGMKESIDNMFSKGIGLTYRDEAWNEALFYYKNNPIFGGGISALFDLNVTMNGPSGAIFFAHNTLVTLLSTCGILGIISFGILLIEFILVILNDKTKNRYAYAFFIMVGLIHGVFDNTFYSIVYMLPLIYIFANNNLKGIEKNKNAKYYQ